MSSRRSFTREFKVDAARQVLHGGKSVAQVSGEIAVGENLLRRWIDQFQAQSDPRDAFPGHGRLPTQEDELRRLRRENAQLREERDI